MRKHSTLIRFALMTVVTALAACCCEGPSQLVGSSVSVSVRTQEVDNKAGSTFVSVKTDGAWTLNLTFGDSQKAWAKLSAISGKGEHNGVILTYEANPDAKARELLIEARCGDKVARATLTQEPADQRPGNLEPGQPKWLELPATKNDDGLDFYWHDQVINGKSMRSFSFDYDPNARLSHWVAYPLNRTLIGGGSRTDEWDYDPKVPENQQPRLFNGFKNYGTRYDRGHQLPSADRYNYDANVQTFYFTNMTPQRNDFNGYIWADLEGRVRDWARSMDTLYVVTGCYVLDSKEYAYDNNEDKVTVPTAYYKALLGFKKAGTIGLTSQTGGYTACAFWFPHKPYSGDVMDKSMTIAELEGKTGINFFVNLPSVIGSAMAEKVETTKDPLWK